MKPGPAHFRRAIELEPEFAAAHAGLAESHFWTGFMNALPPIEAFPNARRHAHRALVHDPDLPDAHWLLAEIALWHDWDVDAAERHIARTLALDENHPEATKAAAICHFVRRRRREALAAATAALRLDPLSAGMRIWFVAVAFNVDEYALAAEVTRLIDDRPQYSEAYRWRAMIHLVRSDHVAARADLDTAMTLARPNFWSERSDAIVSVLEGNVARAIAIRDDLLRRSASEWVSPLPLAQIEQVLGNYDAAFAHYERARQGREHLMVILHTDRSYQLGPPSREPITADPRWEQLLRHVGVAGV